jgi:hypothetical protein
MECRTVGVTEASTVILRADAGIVCVAGLPPDSKARSLSSRRASSHFFSAISPYRAALLDQRLELSSRLVLAGADLREGACIASARPQAGQEIPGDKAERERDKGDYAPLYSITSSARASSVGWMSMPSALAVERLMTNSNLLDWTTGKSAGLAPGGCLDRLGCYTEPCSEKLSRALALTRRLSQPQLTPIAWQAWARAAWERRAIAILSGHSGLEARGGSDEV